MGFLIALAEVSIWAAGLAAFTGTRVLASSARALSSQIRLLLRDRVIKIPLSLREGR